MKKSLVHTINGIMITILVIIVGGFCLKFYAQYEESKEAALDACIDKQEDGPCISQRMINEIVLGIESQSWTIEKYREELKKSEIRQAEIKHDANIICKWERDDFDATHKVDEIAQSDKVFRDCFMKYISTHH